LWAMILQHQRNWRSERWTVSSWRERGWRCSWTKKMNWQSERPQPSSKCSK
jgi:hypothetical protein